MHDHEACSSDSSCVVCTVKGLSELWACLNRNLCVGANKSKKSISYGFFFFFYLLLYPIKTEKRGLVSLKIKARLCCYTTSKGLWFLFLITESTDRCSYRSLLCRTSNSSDQTYCISVTSAKIRIKTEQRCTDRYRIMGHVVITSVLVEMLDI